MLALGPQTSGMVFLLLLSTLACATFSATSPLWTYVDPFIGTSSPNVPGTISGSGNVFPGATLPFGSET